jgi:hypothetical protein
MPRRGRLLLLLAGGLAVAVCVFALGRMTAPDTPLALTVEARYGAPSLQPGEDAMVVLSAPLIEEAVASGLATVPGPVEFSDPEVGVSPEGLSFEAVAALPVFGFAFRARVSTVAIPAPNPDGSIGVNLVETRAVGARVPGRVEDVIEDVLDRELTRLSRPRGYSVTRVEMGEGQVFVYLRVDVDEIFATGQPLPD